MRAWRHYKFKLEEKIVRAVFSVGKELSQMIFATPSYFLENKDIGQMSKITAYAVSHLMAGTYAVALAQGIEHKNPYALGAVAVGAITNIASGAYELGKRK